MSERSAMCQRCGEWLVSYDGGTTWGHFIVNDCNSPDPDPYTLSESEAP